MTTELFSTEQKMLKLVQRLHAKTAAGQVPWEQTATEDVFQASFPNYVVRIFRKPGSSAEPDYLLTIRDAVGKLIESTSDVAINEAISDAKAFTLMKELHDMARRQVFGVDKALDSLLSELE
jgi:hypothetical protein